MFHKRKTPPTLPSDQELLHQLASGQDSALSTLMERYDRLVRFTVFRCSKSRCLQDPDWLDSVASEVWSSLVFSARRRDVQSSQFRVYLIQMTRFKSIDAIRRGSIPRDAEPSLGIFRTEDAMTEFDATSVIDELDEIELIQSLVARLNDEERAICSRIHLIVERRWREAGAELGIAESTLRSKWPKILDRLRGFMNKSDT